MITKDTRRNAKMGKLVTYKTFQERRKAKPLPEVNYNERDGTAELIPFSRGVVTRKEQRNRKERLRLQLRNLRATLRIVGLPQDDKEFMLFVICFVRDQEDNPSLAKIDQYRHLRECIFLKGESIIPKYHEFAAAMAKLHVVLPNFSWERLSLTTTGVTSSSEIPPEIA